MSHASTIDLHQHEHDGKAQVKKIWKTFWILLFITLAELAIGLTIYTIHKGEHPNHTLVLMFKGLVCILTLAKAFYIVAIFMHLGDEVRNLVMTIIVPLLLFVWFIIAFLWDGNAWRDYRNTDAGSRPNTEKVHKENLPAIDKGKKD